MLQKSANNFWKQSDSLDPMVHKSRSVSQFYHFQSQSSHRQHASKQTKLYFDSTVQEQTWAGQAWNPVGQPLLYNPTINKSMQETLTAGKNGTARQMLISCSYFLTQDKLNNCFKVRSKCLTKELVQRLAKGVKERRGHPKERAWAESLLKHKIYLN